MSVLGEFGRRVWFLINRRRFEATLQREMQSHRAMMEEPRRFGNVLRLREESRDVWGWQWLDDLVRDLRYAGRELMRAPGFSLVAVFSLALATEPELQLRGGDVTAFFEAYGGTPLDAATRRWFVDLYEFF